MVDDSTRKPTRLVLLDRDGVVNHDSPDYVKSAAEWHPIAGSLSAIAQLNNAGIHTALCSNQAGISRGLIEPSDLAAIHVRFALELSNHGGHMSLWRFCPHIEADQCNCRKPGTAMLLDCMHELGVSPEETLFVGDSPKDMQAAITAGCEGVFVRSGYGGTERLAGREQQARDIGVSWIEDTLATAVNTLLVKMTHQPAPSQLP